MTKIEFDEPSKGNVNSADPALEISQSGDGGAITATCKKRIGIIVEAGSPFGDSGTGIYAIGMGENGIGLEGKGEKGIGVKGTSLHHSGVFGIGKDAGVNGQSNDHNGIGVKGQCSGEYGTGVYGEAENPNGGTGVLGKSKSWVGVYGESDKSIGIYGKSTNGVGVYGEGPNAAEYHGYI